MLPRLGWWSNSARPDDSHAWLAATDAIFATRLIFRIAGKLSTAVPGSGARHEIKLAPSKSSIAANDSPARMLFQNSSTVVPAALCTPMPVTTTGVFRRRFCVISMLTEVE